MLTKSINKVSDFVDKISCFLVILLMAGMVFFTTIQIIARVFFEAISWSEEITRYLLVWATFIGAGCVYKRNGHINVTFVQDALKGNTKKIIQVLVHIICIAFFAIATYYGIKYLGRQGAQRSPALGIKMNTMYLSIPVGCSIMFLHAVNSIMELISKKEEKE